MIEKDNIISEKQIEDIIYNTVRVDTYSTKLPVDIFCIDTDIQSFIDCPIMLLFRNSYDCDSFDFMPISVCDKPKLLTNKALNITEYDYEKIICWIFKHKEIITLVFKEKLDNSILFKLL